METKQKTLIIPLLIVGIMFFVIGFGVGIAGFLIPALKSIFLLSTGESYLVTAAIFSAFVLFGSPAGMLIKKIGYRKSMMYAFFIMSLGMLLFIPAANFRSFYMFLFALFVGGVGNTLLQASVNPYVTIIGPNDSAAMRMCLMGIMNKTAWYIASLFLGLFINLSDVKVDAIHIPFYIVAAILLILGVFTYYAPLPEVKAEGEEESSTADYAKGKTSIWQFPHLLLGAFALFLYVGIETLPMASIIDFAGATFGKTAQMQEYSLYVTAGLVAGYIFGVVSIPRFISQTNALIVFSLIGITASLLLIFSPAQWAFYCLLLVSFANSLMWPAIWPLAISDLGKYTKTGSSILVMGIFGGAVIPMVFGFLVDMAKGNSAAMVTHYQTAYWVLVPAYFFILYYAVSGHKIRN